MLMARIFIGSSPITFMQAPRFFPCLNDTSRSIVRVIFGVRISRRYGGPWLPLASLFVKPFIILNFDNQFKLFPFEGCVGCVAHAREKKMDLKIFVLFFLCGRYNSARIDLIF